MSNLQTARKLALLAWTVANFLTLVITTAMSGVLYTLARFSYWAMSANVIYFCSLSFVDLWERQGRIYKERKRLLRLLSVSCQTLSLIGNFVLAILILVLWPLSDMGLDEYTWLEGVWQVVLHVLQPIMLILSMQVYCCSPTSVSRRHAGYPALILTSLLAIYMVVIYAGLRESIFDIYALAPPVHVASVTSSMSCLVLVSVSCY